MKAARPLTKMRRLAVLALWVSVLAVASACKEKGDIKVTALKFDGARAISDAKLAAVLSTKSSGWLPWAPKQYFDRQEFEADLLRLRQYYQDRGFADARITGVDVDLDKQGDAVRLTIHIDEGEPTIVEAVNLKGFDDLDPAITAGIRDIALKAGAPRDGETTTSARSQLTDLLKDHGFAYGTVATEEQAGSGAKRVVVAFTARPGPRSTFGKVSVAGLSNVDENVITRQLSFREGQPYRSSRVTQSQRRLAQLQILSFASIDARPGDGPPTSEVPVRVVVAENPPRRFQLGAGYGSEERARGSIEWSHLNFFGDARQVTASAKYSSLARGFGLSFNQPYLYRGGLSLDATASNWWTVEDTYHSHTYGGRAGVSYRIGSRGRGGLRLPSDIVRVAYNHQYLRYEITPEALEDLSGFETLIALGLDPITGKGQGTKASIETSFESTAVDNATDPHRGYGMAVHVEHARPWLGGTFRYDELLVDGRGYIPVGDRFVLAGRARLGTLASATDSDVPFSERYFLGGSSSLRGWGRYQVSPLDNGQPVGGRTTLDLAAEIRIPLSGPLGAVAFFDAGNVWPDSWQIKTRDLLTDGGIGLRYATVIGLVRADIGYQLKQLPGLLVEGVPESRRYRLHISIGQSF
ncbi:MAG: BamA/TamA family outer membrane protein [Acidobacteriota bacterium]